FLLRYPPRPLHFFGRCGMLAILAGGGIGIWLAVEKLLRGMAVMEQHGPLLIFAAVLILAGVQLLALGLLGEMQVRHYFEPERQPYSVERVIKAESHAREEISDKQ